MRNLNTFLPIVMLDNAGTSLLKLGIDKCGISHIHICNDQEDPGKQDELPLEMVQIQFQLKCVAVIAHCSENVDQDDDNKVNDHIHVHIPDAVRTEQTGKYFHSLSHICCAKYHPEKRYENAVTKHTENTDDRI